MRRKEGPRITLMKGVKTNELSQMQTSELLGLSYRQATADLAAVSGTELHELCRELSPSLPVWLE